MEEATTNSLSVTDREPTFSFGPADGEALAPKGENSSECRPWPDDERKRRLGITYTPESIVTAMVAWAKNHGEPSRVVDAGAGAGVFTFAAAAAFPDAEIVAIELDELSADRLATDVAASDSSDRIRVVNGDYLSIDELPPIDGRTLFLGNPPYVRHHLIEKATKDRFVKHAEDLGLTKNTKAGLHLYFLLQSRRLAKDGDYGIFITAAEWLHTDYGASLRKLLSDGMGALSIDVFPAADVVFPGVHTTAAITCFEVGRVRKGILFGQITSTDLSIGRGCNQDAEVLAKLRKWSHLTEVQEEALPRGLPEWIRVGDIFKVRRGQVTGANPVWLQGRHTPPIPDRFLTPVISRATQLKGGRISDDGVASLKMLVDLPVELDHLEPGEQEQLETFKSWAMEHGAHQTYVAQHRSAWWAVQPYEPAPVICSYMGRRPPIFALNEAHVRHLNIAHGLYPKREISPVVLGLLVDWLNVNVSEKAGRTYAGALVKFEPSDVADILIPTSLLEEGKPPPPAGRLGMSATTLGTTRS